MTNEHTSLEKYTSHTLFSKGLRKVWCWLCVRGELETEQTATYWSQFPLYYSSTPPHSAGLLNRGPEGPSPMSDAGSLYGFLSSTATGTRTVTSTRTELCLPRTLSRPGYIIVCRPPASCGRTHLHRIQPVQVKGIFRYLRPDAPVSWLTTRLRVNMLHCYQMLTIQLNIS